MKALTLGGSVKEMKRNETDGWAEEAWGWDEWKLHRGETSAWVAVELGEK